MATFDFVTNSIEKRKEDEAKANEERQRYMDMLYARTGVDESNYLDQKYKAWDAFNAKVLGRDTKNAKKVKAANEIAQMLDEQYNTSRFSDARANENNTSKIAQAINNGSNFESTYSGDDTLAQAYERGKQQRKQVYQEAKDYGNIGYSDTEYGNQTDVYNEYLKRKQNKKNNKKEVK